jgi:hypothetical protein
MLCGVWYSFLPNLNHEVFLADGADAPGLLVQDWHPENTIMPEKAIIKYFRDIGSSKETSCQNVLYAQVRN